MEVALFLVSWHFTDRELYWNFTTVDLTRLILPKVHNVTYTGHIAWENQSADGGTTGVARLNLSYPPRRMGKVGP